MDWRKANRAQLIDIAFYDHGARLEHRIAAAAELKRRNRKEYGRTNCRPKVVYPK